MSLDDEIIEYVKLLKNEEPYHAFVRPIESKRFDFIINFRQLFQYMESLFLLSSELRMPYALYDLDIDQRTAHHTHTRTRTHRSFN